MTTTQEEENQEYIRLVHIIQELKEDIKLVEGQDYFYLYHLICETEIELRMECFRRKQNTTK